MSRRISDFTLEEDPSGEDQLDHIIVSPRMSLFGSLTNYCCFQHVGPQEALFPFPGSWPVTGCESGLQLSLTKAGFCLLGHNHKEINAKSESDASLYNLVYKERVLIVILQLTGHPVFLALGLLMQIEPSLSPTSRNHFPGLVLGLGRTKYKVPSQSQVQWGKDRAREMS